MSELGPADEALMVDADVLDSAGTRIGSVTEVYRSDNTQHPSFVAVDLGDAVRFVPVEGAEVTAGVLRVAFGEELVRSAPEYDAEGGQLEPADAALLYDHYGLPHGLPYQQGSAS
ncbi:hypothetical protein EV189_1276 [Motilibacter rhizosphaerae]|uniref:PRC-barrel domain protein n=1 Tax=Motilibacter rhizosphaerae TaxID=598652 RepID=A0A4V2F4J2_9ACTN|nr:PRC-barrel domain containing protein [Motilibacter rhizosphaerae]RZS89509.1 hypothetical protein EV189_1276 [Motilibacter rhizosphaerae]